MLAFVYLISRKILCIYSISRDQKCCVWLQSVCKVSKWNSRISSIQWSWHQPTSPSSTVSGTPQLVSKLLFHIRCFSTRPCHPWPSMQFYTVRLSVYLCVRFHFRHWVWRMRDIICSGKGVTAGGREAPSVQNGDFPGCAWAATLVCGTPNTKRGGTWMNTWHCVSSSGVTS